MGFCKIPVPDYDSRDQRAGSLWEGSNRAGLRAYRTEGTTGGRGRPCSFGGELDVAEDEKRFGATGWLRDKSA